MHGEVKDGGVVRKLVVEAAHEVERAVAIFEGHGAAQAVHAGALFFFRILGPRPGRFEQRQGFFAMAGFGQFLGR